MKLKHIVVAVTMSVSFAMYSSSTHANELLEGWSGDAFVGYNNSNGNTEKGAFNLTTTAVKQLEASAITLKGSLSYGETNNSMDTQKWDALAKYAFDFGQDNRWFNFYQVYVDHDRFADIDYRITPSVGVGYHIAREERFTWDVDAGLGYRITRHRVATSDDDEVPTALLHTFIKKGIFEKAFISEDLTVYPGLESDAGVVLRSESVLSNPLSEKMDLEIKYIVDFNTEPAADKEKTDTQLLAGLKYKF